jgi:AcrR family transcriptional regulator
VSDKASRVRGALLEAGLETFNTVGYEAATIGEIRGKVDVSNGSFFHFFPNKRALAATLFIDALQHYHAAMQSALTPSQSATDGVKRLISTHIGWVVENRPRALFLFEKSRAEWLADVREAQAATNRDLRDHIEAWREPLIHSGDLQDMSTDTFISQIIGPAQIFCRAWLSGRNDEDPRCHANELTACAIRALIAREGFSPPRGAL